MNLGSSWSALGEAVAAAKANDPLAPVTVVTSGGSMSRDVVSWLTRAPDFAPGLVHVRVVPVSEFIRIAASGSSDLGERSEVTPIQREAACRKVVQDDPGVFGELAASRHTVRALARTSASLDGVLLPESVLGVSALTDEVIRIDGAVRRLISQECVTPNELVDAAKEALSSSSRMRESLGTLIVFLPITDRGGLESGFVHWLMSLDGVETIPWPVTEFSAEQTKTLLSRAQVITASNPDDEARAIARLVVDEISAGTPGHRIGIFFGPDDPYRLLLHRYVTEANVAVSGRLPRQLADQSMSRYLLRLLADPDVQRLDPILALDALAAHALVDHEQTLPSLVKLERVYRNVRFSAEDDDVAELDDDSRDRLREDMAIRDAFVAFLDAVGEDIRHVLASATWEQVSERLVDLCQRRLRPKSSWLSIPDSQGISLGVWWDKLQEAIASLAGLDHVGVSPTPSAIVEELEQAISLAKPETRMVGRGVLVSGLDDGVGRDLDVVIVCGLAEGILPSRFSPDPLLPDEFVKIVGADLDTALDKVTAQRNQFFRALLSATKRVVLTLPRGDLRGSGNRVPSRWLVPLMDEEGAIGAAKDIASLQSGVFDGEPAQSEFPAFPRELRIRRGVVFENDLWAGLSEAHVSSLLSTKQMVTDRFGGAFTRFNGNLGEEDPLDILSPERKISPSSLERYASAPLSFFLQDVLGARPLASLDIASDMDSLQRGNLVHEVLEVWVRDHPAPTADDLDSLISLLHERAAVQKKHYGSFWIDVFHERTVAGLAKELTDWFDEHLRRLGSGARVLATERSFGKVENERKHTVIDDVSVTLPDGTDVSFVGQVDRIDLRSDGVYEVIDYKTGSQKSASGISSEPPTGGRKKFQLAIYGLLARDLAKTEKGAETLSASYWFVRDSADYTTSGEPVCYVSIALDDEAFSKIDEDLGLVLGLIRGGFFPPMPGNPRVDTYTQLLGPSAMEDAWEKLRADDQLEPFLRVFDLLEEADDS